MEISHDKSQDEETNNMKITHEEHHKEETVTIPITTKKENQQKENGQASPFSEEELSTRDELALDTLLSKSVNTNTNGSEENVPQSDPMDEDFTTVTYKKKKDKRPRNDCKIIATRQVPYKKRRSNENSSKA
ncbi:4338_t:CDS:1, partial [Ambispora leptoticha]